VIAAFLNPLLMIAMPVLFGIALAQRLKAEWRLFGLGILSFVGSQALHLPFNGLVLGPLTKAWRLEPAPGSWGLALIGVLFGLSAGVFEESARYVVYRRWVARAHSPDSTGRGNWRDGLMLGAGHGGSEAIILGLLAFYSFLQLWMLRGADLSAVVEPGRIAAIRSALQTYWSFPSYGHLLPAFERAATLCVHLALSLLVLQSLIRRSSLWFGLAILWHTLVDAAAVFAAQTWGVYVAEGIVALSALISVAIIFWLRGEETEEPETPVGLPTAVVPPAYRETNRELRPDELEQSRYT